MVILLGPEIVNMTKKTFMIILEVFKVNQLTNSMSCHTIMLKLFKLFCLDPEITNKVWRFFMHMGTMVVHYALVWEKKKKKTQVSVQIYTLDSESILFRLSKGQKLNPPPPKKWTSKNTQTNIFSQNMGENEIKKFNFFTSLK